MKTNIFFLNKIHLTLLLLTALTLIIACVHPVQVPVAPVDNTPKADSMLAIVTGDANIDYYASKVSIDSSSANIYDVWGSYKFKDTTYTVYLNLPKKILPGSFQVGSLVDSVTVECTFSKLYPTSSGDEYVSYFKNQSGTVLINKNDSNAVSGIFNASAQTADGRTVSISNGIFYCKKK